MPSELRPKITMNTAKHLRDELDTFNKDVISSLAHNYGY